MTSNSRQNRAIGAEGAGMVDGGQGWSWPLIDRLESAVVRLWVIIIALAAGVSASAAEPARSIRVVGGSRARNVQCGASERGGTPRVRRGRRCRGAQA